MIKKLKMDDGTFRFDNILERHNHFICTNCNRIIDLKNNIALNVSLEKHRITDYEITFYGICKHCLKEDENG